LQRALSAVETVAAGRDSRARKANTNQREGGSAAGAAAAAAAATSAAHLRVAALRAALAAAAEEAAAAGALGPTAWRRCCSVFTSLSSLWAHARDAEAEVEREAADLFRSRTKAPTVGRQLKHLSIPLSQPNKINGVPFITRRNPSDTLQGAQLNLKRGP